MSKPNEPNTAGGGGLNHDILCTLLTGLEGATRDDILLTSDEGHFRAMVRGQLLKRSHTIAFPTSRTKEGKPQVDTLHYDQGNYVWDEEPRSVWHKGGSTDVTVVRPVSFQLELKVRADYGSSSQALANEIKKDLDTVANGNESRYGFVFAFDSKIYQSFSGGKTEPRGKKSDLLTAIKSQKVFPDQSYLKDGEIDKHDCEWEKKSITVFALKQIVQGYPEGRFRILVAGMRTLSGAPPDQSSENSSMIGVQCS